MRRANGRRGSVHLSFAVSPAIPGTVMGTLEEAKKAARAAAMARRSAAHAGYVRRVGADFAGAALMRRFLAAAVPRAGAPVSGYWPVKGEIDVRPLMRTLAARGHVCGLPVIAAKGKPLAFRRWKPEMSLMPGRWDIPVPPQEADAVIPEFVIVPLLAFDRSGRRLGYGAGFYDRTLALLRGRPGARVFAAGVAYAAQEAEDIPADDSDEFLDLVVTERGAIRFPPR